ncbi:MAG: TauD/TfdA dioxygenase family protein [Burkholderiaceae bacterium]
MLSIKPLHPVFGAEVTAFVWRPESPVEQISELLALFESHSVLVLRGMTLTDAEQIQLSKHFGPLEKTKTGTLGTGSELVILTNLDANGQLVPETHKQWLEGLGNQLWHTDSSFKPVPALASLLSARQIPAQGGQTQFASTRYAYETLPPGLRNAVKEKVGTHDYAYSRSLISDTLMTEAERIELPPVKHPLVRKHPVTGKRGIYVGSHLASIEDMPLDQSRALIDELQAHATRDEAIYTHHWRTGDLVIWDNRFVLHRGRPYPSEQARTMVRTTVAGALPVE